MLEVLHALYLRAKNMKLRTLYLLLALCMTMPVKAESENLDNFLKTRPNFKQLKQGEVTSNYAVYHADTAHALDDAGRVIVAFSRNKVILGFSLKFTDTKLTENFDALLEAIKLAYPGYDIKSASGSMGAIEAILLNHEAISAAKADHIKSLVDLVKP